MAESLQNALLPMSVDLVVESPVYGLGPDFPYPLNTLPDLWDPYIHPQWKCMYKDWTKP